MRPYELPALASQLSNSDHSHHDSNSPSKSSSPQSSQPSTRIYRLASLVLWWIVVWTTTFRNLLDLINVTDSFNDFVANHFNLSIGIRIIHGVIFVIFFSSAENDFTNLFVG